MAGMMDPFSPGLDSDPTAGLPDAGTFQNLYSQWQSFMGSPQGRAAMLAGGLSLLGPSRWGEDTLSRTAAAVGDAGAAVRTGDALALKEREADSKAELRAAQADKAAAGSATSAARADTATARLALMGEAQRGLMERNRLSNLIRLQGLYQNYVKEHNKSQDPLLMPKGQTPLPALGFEDWVRQNPRLVETVGGTSGVVEGASSVGAAPAPTDPGAREVGVVYSTPKGPLKWLGNGQWGSP